MPREPRAAPAVAPVANYAGLSYWLETAQDDLTPRPALDSDVVADVAIMGGGFTGLWTAYYLLRSDPSLRVVVTEREIAGFGASGRNGGWCTSLFTVGPGELARRFGDGAARATQLAMYEAVDEVGRVDAAEGLGAQFHRGGAMRVARGRETLPVLERMLAQYERLGLGDKYRLLDAREATERVGIRGLVGALFTSESASVHPGRLVRGLARAVERYGGVIYEQTAVTGFRTRPAPILRTSGGDVRARIIVLAAEAYLTTLRATHRQVIPGYSLIVLTEPLGASQWAAIGWRDRESVDSPRFTIEYLTHTADGRILFGGRGRPYPYGSRIKGAYDTDPSRVAWLKERLVDWFPALSGVRCTHVWGGPAGVPRDLMPTVSLDRTRGLATAHGYTGHGVATANLAGRVLAQLILEKESSLTELPMVGHTSPEWEPEPLRWLGVRYVQRRLARIDAEAERTGRAPTGRTLAERLASH